jgi:hypothetical protein
MGLHYSNETSQNIDFNSPGSGAFSYQLINTDHMTCMGMDTVKVTFFFSINLLFASLLETTVLRIYMENN